MSGRSSHLPGALGKANCGQLPHSFIYTGDPIWEKHPKDPGAEGRHHQGPRNLLMVVVGREH